MCAHSYPWTSLILSPVLTEMRGAFQSDRCTRWFGPNPGSKLHLIPCWALRLPLDKLRTLPKNLGPVDWSQGAQASWWASLSLSWASFPFSGRYLGPSQKYCWAATLIYASLTLASESARKLSTPWGKQQDGEWEKMRPVAIYTGQHITSEPDQQRKGKSIHCWKTGIMPGVNINVTITNSIQPHDSINNERAEPWGTECKGNLHFPI